MQRDFPAGRECAPHCAAWLDVVCGIYDDVELEFELGICKRLSDDVRGQARWLCRVDPSAYERRLDRVYGEHRCRKGPPEGPRERGLAHPG